LGRKARCGEARLRNRISNEIFAADAGGISFARFSDASHERGTHPMSSSQAVHAVPDVLVRNEGTLFHFCPLTARAKSWIDEYVQSDTLWFGSALVVEHRFAWGLAQGMKDAGLVLA
jgi:hypothetical protein